MRSRPVKLTTLFTALLLCLTACGSGGRREVHKIDWVTSPAYAAEEMPLPVQTGDLTGCCTDGTYIYTLIDEKEGDAIRSVLFRSSLADGTAEVLEEFQPPEAPPEDTILNQYGPILAGDGTLWLCELRDTCRYALPEDFDEKTGVKSDYLTSREGSLRLRQLDPATGREKKRVDLDDALQALELEAIYDITGFTVDAAGNIYLACPGGVTALNGKGKRLFTLEADMPNALNAGSDGGRLALLPDGTAAVLTTRPGKREVRTIDPAAKGWGEARYELPQSVEMISSGTGGFLFYYVFSGNYYGWEPGAEEGRLLLSRAAMELEGVIACFVPLDGGELAALTTRHSTELGGDDFWYSAQLRLDKLSPTDQRPGDGKIKLVYGTIGADEALVDRINEFNQSSGAHYIELRNYAGEGIISWDVTDDMRENARKLLIAEVAAGQAPDIWDKSLPIDLYARKGYLEDLWPYIDSDPEIDREKLLDRVLECASVDGKLYSVFNTFSIQTTAISRERWGDKTGWTLEELLEARRELPEGGSIFGYGAGDRNTLYYLLCQNLDYWVDWTAGECRFDSEEFQELLEACKAEGPAIALEDQDTEKAVAALDGTDLRAGRQLMAPVTLRGPEQLIQYDAMFAGPEYLTDYMSYLYDNDIAFSADCPYYCQAMINTELTQIQGHYKDHRLNEKSVFGTLDHGGYTSYVGYPASGGSGSGFILPGERTYTSFTKSYYGAYDCRCAISSACREKEAAWSFIRQLLLPGGTKVNYNNHPSLINQYDTTDMFPILKEDFEWRAATEYVPSKTKRGEFAYAKDGSPLENPKWTILLPETGTKTKDGLTPISMFIQALAPDEAEMEQFWALYNSIDHVCVEDSALMDIILEQAAPFFAGDRTAAEAADQIQRRAVLYVNENL